MIELYDAPKEPLNLRKLDAEFQKGKWVSFALKNLAGQVQVRGEMVEPRG